MLKSLSFFLKYFVCWCIFFFLSRLFFEIAFYQNLSRIKLSEILPSFFYGLHMDASMAGYICALPFLLFGISFFILNANAFLKPIKIYTLVLLAISSIISIADINIYREWGTKLNYRALEFLFSSPSEALASTASSPILLSIIAAVILLFLGVLLFWKFVFKTHYHQKKQNPLLISTPIYLFVLALTFLAIRGGVSVAPMNTSKAYYSQHQILNFAAINTNWFLMSNLIDHQKTNENPYIYYPQDKLEDKIDSIYITDDTLKKEIFAIDKPNIVFIIMESFTADIVKELGGETDVTPKFSELIKEGLFFNHIYAASDRTDKGIVAVISGFPAQATRSIIKENDKQIKLPSIADQLAKNNYQTSFFYGGDTDFSNFRSYILSNQFQRLIDKRNFKKEELKSNWGAYDNVTLGKQIKYLNSIRQPFFSTLLTLTNHEPFQLPVKGKFGDNSVENKFRSTSYYVDQALYQYIQTAKKQKWYANTIFVITADHGHRLPKNINNVYDPKKYHIPLLILGGALKPKFKGKQIHKYGSQVDIVATVLNQLNLPDTAFKYSKNLLNPKLKGFAFFNWDNGFGYIDRNMAISYDPVSERTIFSQQKTDKEVSKATLSKAKAMMQSVYNDYLKY
ncbi:sulfatase-like hydrolase/transferase [Pedobacter sp. SD-b]|uniref:Sulfatase-like hydrolase/transferase n=1 Tax=Pedobacter segetis TaxID=2793069 RepID=A0ABS1BJE1_9SPHI|nr:alkaline phosphatase family protein [Pedobacter segetis]MBK0383023.1 sulfatase-like hydrolase/transferase [Pedobacter segetis]